MRTLTPAVAAAIAAGTTRVALLVELYFDEATTYANDTAKNLVWNGNTYLGAAQIGSIDALEESSQLQQGSISMTLSGIQSANIALVLADYYQGRKAIIRAAFLDSDHQVIPDPVVAWEGRIDQQTIALGADATITLTAQNRMADWDRPRLRVFNDQDQRRTSPDDAFFEFVPQMVEQPLNWGIVGAPAASLVTSGGFALQQSGS